MPLQIAYFTGQSDPRGSALSPLQHQFLDALLVPEHWKVRVNFPYPDKTAPHRPMPLLAASWHNVRLYLQSRAPEFAARHRGAVLSLIERAERTLFLAGSSGLELLVNLNLPPEVLERIHVFAYGPVARRLPTCDVRLVRGNDWISRIWFRDRGDRCVRIERVACNHLDYLKEPRVLVLANSYLSELRSEYE